jgi:HupE / UreJ protein
VPLALLTFNLGVEAGQLIFVVAVLALVAIVGRLSMVRLPWARTVIGYGIGSLAAVWFVQRLTLML